MAAAQSVKLARGCERKSAEGIHFKAAASVPPVFQLSCPLLFFPTLSNLVHSGPVQAPRRTSLFFHGISFAVGSRYRPSAVPCQSGIRESSGMIRMMPGNRNPCR